MITPLVRSHRLIHYKATESKPRPLILHITLSHNLSVLTYCPGKLEVGYFLGARVTPCCSLNLQESSIAWHKYRMSHRPHVTHATCRTRQMLHMPQVTQATCHKCHMSHMPHLKIHTYTMSHMLHGTYAKCHACHSTKCHTCHICHTCHMS